MWRRRRGWGGIKENGREAECVSDQQRGCLSVSVKVKREFRRWHLISCLTFPVSQGSSFRNNEDGEGKKKEKTTDRRQLKCHKKKSPGAVCWWLNYCCRWRLETREIVWATAPVMLADTYQRPDSFAHPSPRVPHNNRNVLKKKSESEGKGMQDKYCVSIFLPLFQLSLPLTDEQWKCFELCCLLSFTSGFRGVLSNPDVFSQRLIDLLSACHVFPLFSQERLRSLSPLYATYGWLTLAPVNNTWT